ncbi:YoaK family protein [Sandaracinobacteroides hominis]|uniref:YoaK family protein n=1 Tax=Sandaracinobacteroides hominis TaxID=2780086 RepID=UPI002E28B8E1|nr:DUF1275 family protein [Sandaracinobacteroides hominis]
MTLLDRRSQLLAAALAALAGYVDVVGFLALGGFFVSFMSGNSTRIAAGVATEAAAAAIAGLLVLTFVAGVTTGSLLARMAGRWNQPAVLALVGLALALAAPLHQPGAVPGSFLLVAFAMGAENMVFQRNGEVRFGLTYMTGTLVKIGNRLADALSGGPRWAWVPWLLLWCALVAGGVAGALLWLNLGIVSLWIAAGLALLLAALSTFLVPAPPKVGS